MNKRWNKLCVSALAFMALVVPLTACEGQLPTPAADTSTKVAPDLTEAQEKKIRLKMLRLELSTNDLFRASTVRLERGTSYPFARTFNFSLRATF